MKISRDASSIVLPQVPQVAGEVLIEYPTHANLKPVAYPIVETPVVKNFICNEGREVHLLWTKRMFNLEFVAVTRGVNSRASNATFEQVAIA